MFSMFQTSLLHSCHVLLSRYEGCTGCSIATAYILSSIYRQVSKTFICKLQYA